MMLRCSKRPPTTDVAPSVRTELPAPAVALPAPVAAASVVAVLTGLRPLLDADTAHPEPLVAVLRLVAGMVPTVQGAALTRRRRSGHASLQTVAITDPMFESVDAAQVRSGRGPVADAMNGDVTVVTKDVTRDARWPTLHRRLTGTGPLAVLSIPVRDDHRRVTVLTHTAPYRSPGPNRSRSRRSWRS